MPIDGQHRPLLTSLKPQRPSSNRHHRYCFLAVDISTVGVRKHCWTFTTNLFPGKHCRETASVNVNDDTANHAEEPWETKLVPNFSKTAPGGSTTEDAFAHSWCSREGCKRLHAFPNAREGWNNGHTTPSSAPCPAFHHVITKCHKRAGTVDTLRLTKQFKLASGTVTFPKLKKTSTKTKKRSAIQRNAALPLSIAFPMSTSLRCFHLQGCHSTASQGSRRRPWEAPRNCRLGYPADAQ